MSNPFTTTRVSSTEPPEPLAVDAEFEDITPDVNVISDVTIGSGLSLRQRLGLLEENEVAGALGLQDRTLKSWRTERTGPVYVKAGKSVFYLFDDVRNWLHSRRVMPDETTETTQTTTEKMGESNDDAEARPGDGTGSAGNSTTPG